MNPDFKIARPLATGILLFFIFFCISFLLVIDSNIHLQKQVKTLEEKGNLSLDNDSCYYIFDKDQKIWFVKK